MKPNVILGTIIENAILQELLPIKPEKLIVHDIVHTQDSLKLALEFKFNNKYYFKNFNIHCQ